MLRVSLLALLLLPAVTGCDPPIALAEATNLRVELALPPIARPANAPALTALIEIPGLLEAPLLVTDDGGGDATANGTFSFAVDKAATVAALVRIKGQLDPSADTATLLVADVELAVAPGAEVGLTAADFTSAPTEERPWLDLNRNGRDNRTDYESACDPAVPANFLRVSEATLQLVRDGDRAALLVDNVLPRSIHLDVAVIDAPGVGVDVVSGTGDATSLAELNQLELAAGQSIILSVSFAAVDAAFSQGVIAISGVDDIDSDACQTRMMLPVRVVANIAGLPRAHDPDDVLPTPFAVAGLAAADITAAPLDNLASGIPLNVDLDAAGNDRAVAVGDDVIPADAAFVVAVPEDGSLDVAVGEAVFDVDLTVVGLVGGVPTVLGQQHLPAGNLEAIRLRNPDDFAGAASEVLVLVGPSGATEVTTLDKEDLQTSVAVTLRTSTRPRLTTRPTPQNGPVDGGTVVALNGEGLDVAGTVFFGDRLASCVIVDNVVGDDALTCTSPRGTLTAGENPADIVYVDPVTDERATLVGAFRFDPVTPRIDSVEPSVVVVGSDAALTIRGFGFVAPLQLLIDGQPVQATVVDDSTLFADAPDLTAGAKDLTVTVFGRDGAALSVTREDGVLYLQDDVPPPSLTSVFPSSGDVVGGTTVNLSGSGFSAGAAVFFGDDAADVVFVGATTIIVQTPTAAPGTVDVRVENADAQEATLAAAFTFTVAAAPPPVVFSLLPSQGSTAGGESVTVLGANFDDAEVRLDGVAMTLTSQSENALVFTTPAHAAGSATLVVENGDGQSAQVDNGFSWRDDVVIARAPVVVDVAPDVVHGLVGGEVLRLIGNDLDQTVSATAVVGATRLPATIVSQSTSLVIVSVAAVLPPGTVHVELVDALLGAHNSPDVTVSDPVPVDLTVSPRAQDDQDYALLIAGSDLNPAALTAVRFTPLDPASGSTEDLAPVFKSETLVSVSVDAGLLGQGGWVVSFVYGSGAGEVTVDVDTFEVGGFCPGSALCDLCGNNLRDPGEDCDGSDFGGESCQGNGFSGGTLGCSGCQFDFNACAQCGNGAVEIGELCDGANLDGQSCTTRGFTAGSLTCDGTCLFNTTACRTCGDAVCSTGETSANCAADCPATCGNLSCNVGETCNSCPRDCGTCAPYRMVLISGGAQQTRITETFPAAVNIRVVDDNNNPVPNVDIVFNVEPGDITSAATRVTDLNGEAVVSWTPASRVGTHQLIIAATARDGATITDQPLTVANLVNDVAAGTIVHLGGRLDGNVTAGSINNAASLRTGLQFITGIALEPGGDLLLLDRARLTRLKMPEGVYEHVAGDPLGLATAVSDQVDFDGGPAVSARFVGAIDVAVDAAGVIYVADAIGNGVSHTIRRIGTDGIITNLAGGGAAGSAQNDGDGGPASAAHFEITKGVAVDEDGNLIVTETTRMRRVLLGGPTPTTATLPFAPARLGAVPDGVIGTGLGHPVGLPNGQIAVVISSNRSGFINTIGVLGESGTSVAAQAATISAHLCRGNDGAFYGGSNSNFRIFRHDGAGGSATVAGTGVNGQAGDLGAATAAQIGQPGGCAVDAAGNLYFLDRGNGGNFSRLRMVRAAALSSPLSVALRVVSGGTQTGIAGGSLPASIVYSVDSSVGGSAASVGGALLGFSSSQAGTFAGNPTLASVGGVSTNPRLGRTVGALGATAAAPISAFLIGELGVLYPTTSTATPLLRLPIAGESTQWLSGASFVPPGNINTIGIDGDASNIFGSPFVADDGRLILANDAGSILANKSVMVVNADGSVTRVAGGGTDTVLVGDGGLALGATLPGPVTAAEDADGNIYVGDSTTRTVRIITPDGLIDRFAGGGVASAPVDARSLSLNGPLRLAFMPDGDVVMGDINSGVFIVDGATRVARQVVASGNCSTSTVQVLSNRAMAVTTDPNAGAVVVARVNNNNAACPVASGHHVFDIANDQLVLPPRVTLFNGATSENIIGAAIDSDGTIYWITEIGSIRVLHRRSAAGVLSVVAGLTSPYGVATDPVSGLVFVYDFPAGGGTALRVIAP